MIRIAPYSVRATQVSRNTPLWQRFASTRAATPESETLKSEILPPKPKSNTNLRKTASASLSIREKPTATRGAILPVFTISTAERYILPPLLKNLESSNATMLADALWLPAVHAQQTHRGEDVEVEHNVGEAFIFGNGCAVFWGIQEEDARRFLNNLVRNTGVEIGQYTEEETEEVEFVMDPTEYSENPIRRILTDTFFAP